MASARSSVSCFLSLLLILLLGRPAIAQTVGFTRVHVTPRVSLELPSDWIMSGVDGQQSLSVLEAAGGPLAAASLMGNPRRILFAVNPDDDRYASVNIVVNSNAAWQVGMLITEEFTAMLDSLLLAQQQRAAANLGLAIISNVPADRIDLPGGAAVLASYLRTDPDGPVKVEQSFHPKPGVTATITISARASEWDAWWPVLTRIRNSVRVIEQEVGDTAGRDLKSPSELAYEG